MKPALVLLRCPTRIFAIHGQATDVWLQELPWRRGRKGQQRSIDRRVDARVDALRGSRMTLPRLCWRANRRCVTSSCGEGW
ncbi:MAG TPA: hypothetical protein VK932_06000, partial [Kofleriaceae bacterium]|nr:hypothetical protein [Kofleriaceae bacterium]